MKYLFLIFVFLYIGLIPINAQSYKSIDIGFTTTVHLIFPNTIKNFDVGLGNVGEFPDILVEKAGNNRLKIAAGIRNFTSTNLFVETDEEYYNIILNYSDAPTKLLYNLSTNDAEIVKDTTIENVDIKKDNRQTNIENSDYIDLSLTCININENRFIYANGILGIEFKLNAIYVDNDKLLFKFSIKNNSNVKYEVGYLGYVIHKKGRGKRQGVVSDEMIQPVYSFQDFNELYPNEEKKIVSIFNKFTLDKKKKLIISLWEKEGERKIDLIVTPKQIIKATKI